MRRLREMQNITRLRNGCAFWLSSRRFIVEAADGMLPEKMFAVCNRALNFFLDRDKYIDIIWNNFFIF